MLLFSTMRNIHIVKTYTLGRICLKRTFLPRGKYCFAEGGILIYIDGGLAHVNDFKYCLFRRW